MLHTPSPAASTNTRANGSEMRGFSLAVSAARAAATPRAVAPTLWVMSQESSSVRCIAIFPLGRVGCYQTYARGAVWLTCA